MRYLRRTLGITWRDKVTNNELLEHAGISSVFTFLPQRFLGWMGESQKISYMEHPSKGRKEGPLLRYKDTCKLDLKGLGLNRPDWEQLVQNKMETICKGPPQARRIQTMTGC
jgi:hypothetical protein